MQQEIPDPVIMHCRDVNQRDGRMKQGPSPVDFANQTVQHQVQNGTYTKRGRKPVAYHKGEREPRNPKRRSMGQEQVVMLILEMTP